MKVLWIIIPTLVLFLSTAHAEWVPITQDYNAAVFVDPSTIENWGARSIRMTQMVTFSALQAEPIGNGDAATILGARHRYFSLISQAEYNCVEPAIKPLSLQLYSGAMGTGSKISDNSFRDQKWESVTESSQALWNQACK